MFCWLNFPYSKGLIVTDCYAIFHMLIVFVFFITVQSELTQLFMSMSYFTTLDKTSIPVGFKYLAACSYM